MVKSNVKALANARKDFAFIHASMFVVNRLINKILQTKTYRELQDEVFALQLKDMGNMSLDVMNKIVDLSFPDLNESTATNEAFFQYAHDVREQSLYEIKKNLFDEIFYLV